MKIKKPALILAIFLLMIVAFFVYKALKPPVPTYNIAKVAVGNILQEISETGSINKGEAISLNFKIAGTIQKIDAAVGQKVVIGEALGELDVSDLQLRLAEAKANADLASIKLNRLQNGASTQDLKIAQSRVDGAKVFAQNAVQNLADARMTAADKIANVYEDALDVLSEVYTKTYNAQNFASLLQRAYFAPQGEDGIKVYEKTQIIKSKTDDIKSNLDSAASSKNSIVIEGALNSVSADLNEIAISLGDIRQICEKVQWRDVVSETDKTSLDGHRDSIRTAIALITSSDQALTSQLVANDYSVNTAKAGLLVANSQLQSAQDEYDSVAAAPRSEDVALLKTQVTQSKTEYDLLQNEVDNAVLKSPVDGEVIAVNKRIGEITQPVAADPVMVVLPTDPFEVDVDIYEEDVVKLKIGDPVQISLTAFPDKSFSGKVTFIDPSEKLVNGVVYYPTKISFDDAPAGLKPGMSVDVAINTVLGVNVVKIPESTLQKKNGSYYVQVLENGNAVERAVTIGARSKTEIEILSGLAVGEQVIIP